MFKYELNTKNNVKIKIKKKNSNVVALFFMDYDDGVEEIKMMKVRLGLCRGIYCVGEMMIIMVMMGKFVIVRRDGLKKKG